MTTFYLLSKLCSEASVEDDGSCRLLLPNRLSKLRFFAAAHRASRQLMILDWFSGWRMNDEGLSDPEEDGRLS